MKFDPALPADGVNVTPTHPLSELGLLLGGLVALVVLLVAGLSLAIDQLVPRIDPALEARLFGSEAEEVEARAAPAQALVERLAVHWPENPYAFHVEVLDAATPNALAFPGGRILVTSGLLEQTKSENELALVLGHEIGHYAHRDHLRGLGRGVALALVLGGLGLADEGGAAGVAALAADLTQRGFSREQERDADRFGLALVQAEYGHLAGAFDFFEKIAHEGEGRFGHGLAPYLSTHPLSTDRIAALRALARARGWPLVGPLSPLAHPAKGGSDG